MTVFSELRTLLLASPTLTGLVGDEIWTAHAPADSSLPYVVCSHVSGPQENQLTGPALFSSHRIQIDCWARTRAAAQEILDAVIAALAGVGFIVEVGYWYDEEIQAHRASADWKRITA